MISSQYAYCKTYAIAKYAAVRVAGISPRPR